jgi:hypothetical protein
MTLNPQLFHSLFPFIGLFSVCVIFGFSWLLAGFLTDRKFKRRERGRQEAMLIGETVEYVSRLFAGRYMPIALCQLVARARQCQGELLRRSWQIENQAQLNGLIRDAVYMRDRLVAASSSPFSALEQEADRLALIAELADVEARAVTEGEQADAAHQAELARIARDLESERARIADGQKLLAALAGKASLP